MYSLLKCNSNLVNKAKYLVDGKLLKKANKKNFCALCTQIYPSITSNFIIIQHDDRKKLLGKNFLKSIRNHGDTHQMRYIHVDTISFYAVEPGKASSKIEQTVTALKEKELERRKSDDQKKLVVKKPPKKPWKQRIYDECLHYYHGFRLLFIDISVSSKLVWKVLKGYSLTRREHKLLVRTVGDLFRLVPFSVFIIVPFLEFTLPFFIKFFPGMLPSTFETDSEREQKLKRSLKIKIEMAKFLQRTLDDMAVASKGLSTDAAKEFAQFFEKVRTSGHMTTSEDIMKFSKLFEDEITLDSLPRPQLMALCRVLDMNPIGTTNFLRFQLRLKLRSLHADDMMIQLEGIDSLSLSELQAACRARGMRALGVSEERLKAQLRQWLDLSLVKKVPPSLLLLSQAFMLPETTPTEEKLAATIQALPDAVCTATKASICEREGKVDYKAKIDMIKEEVAMIKEERLEQCEEEAKIKEFQAKEAVKRAEEELVDKAPLITDRAKCLDPAFKPAVEEMKLTSGTEKLSSDEVTTKDIEALESALDTVGQRKLIVEKEELQELREEMKEYQEDVADLQKLMLQVGKDVDVKETKAAQRLFKKVNNMISKMDTVLNELEESKLVAANEKTDKELGLNENIEPLTKVESDSKVVGEMMRVGSGASGETKTGDETLRIEDLISTIRKLHSKDDSTRFERIKEILSKMDADHDGVVRVDVVMKMLDLVGHENVKLNKKQVDELISLIDKEEVLVQESERKKEDEKRAASSSGQDGDGDGPSSFEGGDVKPSGGPFPPSTPPVKNVKPSDSDKPSGGVVQSVTTTSISNKSEDLDDAKTPTTVDQLTTLTSSAAIQSPPKASNQQQSLSEPSPISRAPKNLR